MNAMHSIHLITIILYCLSVIGYFIDFLLNNRKVNRLAFWLLSIVWLLQTTFFVMRMIELARLPIVTPFEGLFFYAWLLVTLSLILNWFFPIDFFSFFTNIVGFVMMALTIFIPSADVPRELSVLLVSELMVIHISMIIFSYATFTLSFVCSLMYMIVHQMLKKKRWGKRLLRFGSLDKLDQLSYLLVMWGLPIFLLGIILGLIWAYIQLDYVPWFDAKVVSSTIVVTVYAIYFYKRKVKLNRGYQMALFNVAAFLIILINYFLSSKFSTFHLW